MLAGGGNLRVGRVFLKKLNVTDQCATDIDAFKQVMTELGVVRHPSGQCGLKGVYMIQALATISAEGKQVLIQFRHRAGIGIGAGSAGKNLVKQGTLLP